MDDLEGIPGLGAIPVGEAKGNPHPPVVSDDPASLFAEAVHQVTTQMEDRIGQRTFAVLVTSPSVREGKTTTAINLATSMALRGRRVLLIDTNFRRPDLTGIMGLSDRSGLADALSQRKDPLSLAMPVGNLRVLPAGNSSAHPAELVSGPLMSEFIARASEKYDAIVMDGPPAVGFAEIGSLINYAGNAVLVARSGKTHRERLLTAARALSEDRVVGTVLNFARPSDLKILDHGAYARGGKKRIAGAIPVGQLRFWRN
jgi:capsular exopolysaccharide synthesis family protein